MVPINPELVNLLTSYHVWMVVSMVALSTVFLHGYQSLSRCYGLCSLFRHALPFGWLIISGRIKLTVRQCSSLVLERVPKKKITGWNILLKKKSLIRTLCTVIRTWSLYSKQIYGLRLVSAWKLQANQFKKSYIRPLKRFFIFP